VIDANAAVLDSLRGRCIAVDVSALVKEKLSEERLRGFLESLKG
jgi:hypothetical protein